MKSANELNLIISQLKVQGKMSFVNGATQVQIDAFEKEHDIKLPSKLKEWLSFSDGGDLFLPAGLQLYGVAHIPQININDDDSPNDNYIVIGALASGDPVLCQKEGQQISIYNQSAGKIENDEIYPDFFSFLNALYELLGIGD